ncbi:hypothetical protein PoB_005808700 [Plakobranchus ocellatus]|uniref:Uncharacterized protein n=1 Tax=Plakobranchus ocellatus TaxID=259542 RepID=A0AAV4CJ99_9GAST|nr:hypothetical protein PoB_005808700 [Plakobranchus ocellatus]
MGGFGEKKEGRGFVCFRTVQDECREKLCISSSENGHFKLLADYRNRRAGLNPSMRTRKERKRLCNPAHSSKVLAAGRGRELASGVPTKGCGAISDVKEKWRNIGTDATSSKTCGRLA